MGLSNGVLTKASGSILESVNPHDRSILAKIIQPNVNEYEESIT
jgi:hypothetical protein